MEQARLPTDITAKVGSTPLPRVQSGASTGCPIELRELCSAIIVFRSLSRSPRWACFWPKIRSTGVRHCCSVHAARGESEASHWARPLGRNCQWSPAAGRGRYQHACYPQMAANVSCLRIPEAWATIAAQRGQPDQPLETCKNLRIHAMANKLSAWCSVDA
jgi:hypothetical protein